MRIESGLPYNGEVAIEFAAEIGEATGETTEFTLHLRIPSWAAGYQVTVNDEAYENIMPAPPPVATASGYSPYTAFYLPIRRTWRAGDHVHVHFTMLIQLRQSHPRIKSTRDKFALTRGPLVYCLEDVDNPGLDIHEAAIDPFNIIAREKPSMLGGAWVIEGNSRGGKAFTAIPYHMWGNRGRSQMTVYIN